MALDENALPSPPLKAEVANNVVAEPITDAPTRSNANFVFCFINYFVKLFDSLIIYSLKFNF